MFGERRKVNSSQNIQTKNIKKYQLDEKDETEKSGTLRRPGNCIKINVFERKTVSQFTISIIPYVVLKALLYIFSLI